MKILLLILLAVLALALPAPAQLVAVTPYGPNAEGIPSDHPKLVRSITATNEARAGELVFSADALAKLAEKNRDAVKLAVAARPKPVEEAPEPAAEIKALLQRIAALEAKVAALEAVKPK